MHTDRPVMENLKLGDDRKNVDAGGMILLKWELNKCWLNVDWNHLIW
jgi:hypothetical protein